MNTSLQESGSTWGVTVATQTTDEQFAAVQVRLKQKP